MISFNIPRNYRLLIDELLDEKQRYLFGIYLSKLNQSPPNLLDRGELRENVGRIIKNAASITELKTEVGNNANQAA